MGVQGVVGELAMLAILVAIITRWERLPLSSVGIRPILPSDIIIGFCAFIVIVFLNCLTGILYVCCS